MARIHRLSAAEARELEEAAIDKPWHVLWQLVKFYFGFMFWWVLLGGIFICIFTIH